jgi:hypothetical protein
MASAGECVLLSQDEVRFPLVPTLQTTRGVKGHRPVVGTDDNKALVYTCAASMSSVDSSPPSPWTAPLARRPSPAGARPGACKKRLPSLYAISPAPILPTDTPSWC